MASTMHRTVSLDYVVFTNGWVILEMDGGERVELGAGVCSPFLLPPIIPLSLIIFLLP
jgi:hypothetical protein